MAKRKRPTAKKRTFDPVPVVKEMAEEMAEERAVELVTKALGIPRKHHGTFYQAWPKVPELRRYCTQDGRPRIGLEGEDLARAKELIEEYRNG